MTFSHELASFKREPLSIPEGSPLETSQLIHFFFVPPIVLNISGEMCDWHPALEHPIYRNGHWKCCQGHIRRSYSGMPSRVFKYACRGWLRARQATPSPQKTLNPTLKFEP